MPITTSSLRDEFHDGNFAVILPEDQLILGTEPASFEDDLFVVDDMREKFFRKST